MKSNFIIIRYDRLKYQDLIILYKEVLSILEQFDAASLQLSVPFARFHEKAALLNMLDPKDRTKYAREEYNENFKRLDALVSALLLHLKALKRADFPEMRSEVEMVDKLLRKRWGQFVHVGAENKKAALDRILWYYDPSISERWIGYVKKLGVERYVEEIQSTRKRIDALENAEQKLKRGQANSVQAIKAKADVIAELRLLLQNIDLAALNQSEMDYSLLIAYLNMCLKTHRAQLRNLQTRRTRKKEKETQPAEEHS